MSNSRPKHSRQRRVTRSARRLRAEPLERRLLLTSVTAVNPTANSQLAPTSTDISATFDESINPGTATPSTLVAHGFRSGQLSGSVSTAGQTVTFDPSVDLHPGEVVRVTATAAIQSVADAANEPHVWEFRTAVNSGSGQFARSSQLLGNHNTHGMALGDLDGDGDLDVLQGNYNSTILGDPNRVWLNDGTGQFTDSGQLIGNHNARDVALGDLDGDGDLDYMSANYPSMPNRVWFNDGSGRFADSGQLIGNANSWDVEFGDVDGDGDLDAYVGNGYAPNRLYLNNGGGQFTDSGQAMGPGSSQALKLGDLDNDGDLDAFVTNFGTGNRAWLNDGTGIFIDTGQSLGNFLDVEVRLGDMDGDGDLDAVDSNRVWINDGSAIFTDSGQPVGAGNNRVGIGDVDGDGDLDIFYNANVVTVLLNDGNASFSDSGQSLATNGNDCGMELGDLDGDGDLDTYVSHCSQPDVVWINQNLNPSVTLSVDTGSIAEAAGIATVTAALSAAHGQDVTIDLGLSGSATDAADFTLSATQIVIAAGNTSGAVTVTAVQDTADEPDETVVVDIVSVTNGQEAGTQQVTVTILDDDEPVMPDVTLTVDNASIDEAGGVATFTATLSESTTNAVTVDLSISGSASAGEDYTASATQIVIAGGQTSGSIVVTAVDDEVDEENETVIVDIAGVTGGNESGTQQQTTTITDDDNPPSFSVVSFAPGTSGFVFELNGDLDSSDLNLYDTQNLAFGAADAVLVGAASGPVTGSLVVGPSLREVTFIKSGGPLSPDTYAVTLRSGSDAFKDAGGRLLDGDGDGTGGDDYTSSFDITAAAAGTIALSVPDLTRGPGQAVNLPANVDDGIPVTISEGDNVRAIDLRIGYDPAKLSITGATVGSDMPPGATVIVNTNTPGLAILVFFSSTALPAGSSTFVNLQATVPTENASDVYGSQQVLDLHGATISDGNDNESPVLVDDAFHLASYFSDVSGNGRVNAADASQVARFAALIDSGFSVSLLADPIVAGDVSGNGRINAADASLVAQFAAVIDVPVIPPIPGGILLAGMALPPPAQEAARTTQTLERIAVVSSESTTFPVVDSFESIPTDESSNPRDVDEVLAVEGNLVADLEDAINDLLLVQSTR